MIRAMKSVTWTVTLLLAGMLMGSASATEPSVLPKPFSVLLIGNSQCPAIVRNQPLETFRSSLVFEGKRMYVRTTEGLWCIGE